MTVEKPALEPVSEDALVFRDVEIQTATLADGFGYASLNSLCDAFGLNRRAQRRRLLDTADYYDPYTATIVLTTPGGPQPTVCLRSDAIPLFLAGIQVNKVDDVEARELLLVFLGEAHIVLAEHFGLSERGEIQMHREAIARMIARQQALEEMLEKSLNKTSEQFRAELEQRADQIQHEIREDQEETLDKVRAAYAGLRSRISTLEKISGPKERLTPEQLGQLKQTVNTLGTLKMELEGSIRPFPGIYADIFMIAGVSRSEHIPQGKFPEILAFLDRQIEALQKRLEDEKE